MALGYNLVGNLALVPTHGIAAAAAVNTTSYALEALLLEVLNDRWDEF